MEDKIKMTPKTTLNKKMVHAMKNLLAHITKILVEEAAQEKRYERKFKCLIDLLTIER